ncbi:MAG TPA: hypothetical protein VNH11_36270 [Pirellulales bacterium]|nr:hypothetical protein [Pirellulales bacterium]
MVAENATVADYQRLLARVYGNLGSLQGDPGEPETTGAACRRAIEIIEK